MIRAIGLCLAVLNVFGGIVSGIWLVVKGEWRLVLLGFMFSFAMRWVWTLASLPAMGLAAILFGTSHSRTRWVVLSGGFVVAAWNALLIGVWTLLVFAFFIGHAERETVIPLLLWGYSTTMAPLSYMASYEPPDSPGTSFGLLLAVFSYALLMTLGFAGVQWRTMIISLGILCIIEAGVLALLGSGE